MNYSQSFEEFSSGLGPTDLALYAGIGVVLFILFKDKLSPVQKVLLETFNTVKENVVDFTKQPETVTVKVPVTNAPLPVNPVTKSPVLVRPDPNEVFFQLVASWKKLEIYPNNTNAKKQRKN